MPSAGELKTKISLDSAQFKQSMAGVNRQLKGLKNEQKAVTSSGTGFARGLTELRGKSDVLRRTLSLQKTQVAELRRRYEESRSATGDNTKATQNANAAYQKARAEMNRTESQLNNITEEINRQANPWQNLSRNLNETGERFQTMGRSMTTFGSSMTRKVTLPIMGLGAGALKVGLDFEEGMSQVQAVSGATGDELEQLEGQARKMGSETRFSATEAADGMSYLAMAGFDVNEIMDTMPGLLDLAAASGMDLGRAADIASNILSGFGYEAKEAGRVSDVLAKGASTANTNVEQLGGAMKYAAPVANTLGLDIEGLTASVGLMSDAGIQGEKSGRMLRQGLLRLSDPTGKASDLIEELGINVFDSEGNMKDMDKVVGELEKGLEGMDSQARAAALSTIFGTESTAGWSAMLDRGSDELADYTEELENSEGAAEEMAETMESNGKGAMREFKSALEEAGISIAENLIPAFTDIVEKGTELARKFGDLDEKTQKQIITMAGLAAAIGPVSVVLGSATTAAGGLLKVGGSLTGMLGKKGGKGLLGRFGMMGLTGGPVGLAIAGVTGLAFVAGKLKDDTEELNEVSLENANAMMEQYESTDKMIDKFDKLRQQSNLTSDEFARYVDLQSRLEDETNPKVIEAIKEEMADLEEKSGMSNGELDTMVKLNGDLTEAMPGATEKITNQGKKIAGSTEEMRKFNEEKRKMATMEMKGEFYEALENQDKLMQKKKEDQIKLNEMKTQEARVNSAINDYSDENLDFLRQQIVEEQTQIQQKLKVGDLSKSEREELERQNDVHYDILEAMRNGKGALNGQLVTMKNNSAEQEKQLTQTDQEISKLGMVYEKLQMQLLTTAGIGEEKALQAIQDDNALQAVDDKIGKLQQEKEEIKNQTPPNERNTDEYKNQIKKIEDQIGELKNARSELGILQGDAERYTDELGKDVNKNVDTKVNPGSSVINKRLSSPVRKTMRIGMEMMGAPSIMNPFAYAEGTDNHPGGAFIAGEEGWELGRMGNRWEMLNAGVYDRPKGYEVFPHDESKKIIRALDNMPGYASGTVSTGESNRIVNDLNSQTDTYYEPEPINIQLNLTNTMDGKTVGRIVEQHVTAQQQRKQSRQRRAPRFA